MSVNDYSYGIGNPVVDDFIQKLNPALTLSGTEANGSVSQVIEIGGNIWIVTNAIYNATRSGFVQQNTLAPSSAIIVLQTGISQQASAPAGAALPIAWTFTSLIPLVIGGLFNVLQYGAVGNGVTDDSAAIQRAINAAAVAGGTVLFPTGTYGLAATVTLPANVYLKGLAAQVGLTPATTPAGSVILGLAGLSGLDAIVTSASANSCGISDLSFRNCGSAGGWAIHIIGSTDPILRNVAVEFDGFANGQGIFLDGGTANVLGARLDNVSVISGNGHVGAVGLRLGVSGVATETVNASLFIGYQCIGFTTGVALNRGGGLTFIAPWVQNCVTAFAFDVVAECNIFGGWTETNTTNYTFTANAVKNTINGVRDAGGFTTYASGAGIGSTSLVNNNKLTNCSGFNPVGLLASQPTVPGSGVGWTNGTGTDVLIIIPAFANMTGIGIGALNNTGLLATAACQLYIPSGQTIFLQYTSGTPTWKVFGMG